jgi:hypothetical protein
MGSTFGRFKDVVVHVSLFVDPTLQTERMQETSSWVQSRVSNFYRRNAAQCQCGLAKSCHGLTIRFTQSNQALAGRFDLAQRPALFAPHDRNAAFLSRSRFGAHFAGTEDFRLRVKGLRLKQGENGSC